MKRTVTAITSSHNVRQAVVVGKKQEGYELFRVHRGEGAAADLETFCEESLKSDGRKAAALGSELVVGFDSSRAAFYHLRVPAVGPDQMKTVVSLQAEALLPLAIDQMEYAWRAGVVQNGKVSVTIAATRKKQLESFRQEVQQYRPGKVFLESEAVVKAWQVLFDGNEESAAIVYMATAKTQICLAQEGKLALAVSCDVGLDDISQADGLREQSAERLAQDIQSSLKRFGDSAESDLAIYVLSDGRDIFEQTADFLNRTGLNAHAVKIQTEKLYSEETLSASQAYEYAAALGLAIMGIEREDRELKLFETVAALEEEGKRKWRIPSLKLSVAVLLAMLAVFCLAGYKIEAARLDKIENYLEGLESTINVRQLEAEQRIKHAIGAQRIDIVELLDIVKKCTPEEVMLDSFSFRKKSPVSLTGRTKNKDKLYQFRENLQGRKEFKTLRMQNPNFDDKSKEFTFTITFDYKKFGKKVKSIEFREQ